MKGIKKLLGIGVLCIFTIPCLGQSIVNYESYFDNYLVRNIDREDGLYRDEVYDTYQDSLGFIWIANYSFLFKYDGIKLKPFNEGSYRTGIIPEFGEDKNGNMILLGIENGIQTKIGDSLYIQNKDLGLTFSAFSSISRTQGDSLFVGDYEDGLSIVYKDTVITSYDSTNGLAGNKIEHIITDKKNRVWVATTTGVSVFYNGKIKNLDKSNGLPDVSVNTISEMTDGSIWIGTETQGIVVFKDLSPVRYISTKEGLTDNSVEHISQNPIDKSVWIGFISKGIDRYSNDKFENFNEDDGLISNSLSIINFDKSGRVYIGTGFGLTILIPRLVDIIDERTSGITSSESNSIDQDSSGRILMGTLGGGLMIYENGKWRNRRYSKTRSSESVSSIKVANDSTIYISTSEFGVIKYVNDKIVGTNNAQSGLTSNYVVCLETDKDDNLLVGTFDGLNIINKEWQIIDTLTTDEGLPDNKCFNTAKDKDEDVWISTVNNGIYELRGTEVVTHYDTSNGLNSNRVFGLTADSKGEIWAASLEYGFYRVTDEGLKEYPNLPDNFVSITEDNFGDFWFSSNGYIAHVKRSDLDKYDAGEIDEIQYQRFTVDDGFPTSRVNYGNSSLTKKIDTGEILITTRKGLAVINPSKTEADRSSFFTYFDSFTVDGNERSLTEEILIKPSEYRIEISFSALNISAPKKTRFRTRLIGVDEDWNYIGERTSAYFDFPSHGKYTLEVSAIDQSGVWSHKTATISFTVLPPFYKTWWFTSLGLLGFIAIGAGGVQIRSNMKLRALNRELETQQKIQAERERISRELHDNVGSQITNLITGIEISNLHVKKNQQDEALSLLENLDSDARGAMTDLRETIWLLDKEIIEFSVFMDHLTGYLNRQKRYLNGLEVKLSSTVNKKCVLEPGQSMNLTRIIQEALNNTRKYAEAKEIDISFMLQDKMLNLNIVDDGKGMDVDEAIDKGNGLRNMAHRAGEMNAEFQINSKHDSGTKVNLKFEVKIP